MVGHFLCLGEAGSAFSVEVKQVNRVFLLVLTEYVMRIVNI